MLDTVHNPQRGVGAELRGIGERREHNKEKKTPTQNNYVNTFIVLSADCVAASKGVTFSKEIEVHTILLQSRMADDWIQKKQIILIHVR